MGMTLDELTKSVSALKDVKPTRDPRTFQYKVPFAKKNTFFFVRPLAEDLVLASSVMGADDDRAVEFGLLLLDKGQQHAAKAKEGLATKVSGVDWGLGSFDTLLLLGPAVVKFGVIKDDYFLRPRTVLVHAINHIEYSGDETEAEAIVRRGHVLLADVTREITPVIFLRYHKETGQRSAKFLAIAKHEYTTTLINQMPQDGGTVELENYERVRLALAATQGASQLEVTFDGKTAKLSVSDALKLMDTLTMKGAEAAKKDW
jgi:hypothetical protein